MSLFRPVNRSVLVWALMLLAGGVSLLGPGAASSIRQMFHWLTWPAGEPGMYLTHRVRSGGGGESISPDEAKRLRDENHELRNHLQSLKLRQMYFKRVGENGREVFSRLFKPNLDPPVRIVPARVVAADSLPYGQVPQLSVGTSDGAEKGMLATTRRLLTDRSQTLPEMLSVLSGVDLAGRLIETAPFTARVQLVCDRGFEIRAHIRRVIDPSHRREVQYRGRTVLLSERINYPIEIQAYGNGSDGLIVREVKSIHGVRSGDVLQTRPNDPMLPLALNIGTVVEVRKTEHPGMVEVHVRASADLQSLREVFLVVPDPSLRRLQNRGGS